MSPKLRADKYLLLFHIRYYLKMSLICNKFLAKKPKCKNLKINYQQRRGRQNTQYTKTLHFLKDYFLPLCPTKYYYYKVFLPIFNNISEQNYLNKPMFNNVNRLNHSSLLNNTVPSKIKNFHRLFDLGPKMPLKLKCHHHNQP